jgi:hypothetical protein
MVALRYEHRQWSWLPSLGVLAALAAAGLATTTNSGAWSQYRDWVWIAPVIAALVWAAFSSLRITIDANALHWQFGPGIWRKRIGISEIAAVDVTRTSFCNGWGIHRTRRGWLYNVAGFDAVIVSTHNGKSVLLGTDEPKRLANAIRRVANLR